MINGNSNDLDVLLKDRYVPESSPDLSERIIDASRDSTAESRWSIWVKEITSIFVMPRPAMAFASIVFMAFLVMTPILLKSPESDQNLFSTQEYFASVMEDDFIFEAFEISSL